MECLDEDTVLAFCGGRLAAEERARVEEHLAECDDCRALVSAVAKVDTAMAPTTPAPGTESRGVIAAPVGPGDVLADKFEVERVLGAGGMGVVVAARHKQLDRKVALKFLLPAACEVPGAVSRFLREGKAAARITSEHVAKVTDTGILDGGAPYLVMEYLDGQDLGAVAKERGAIPASEAVEYVLQACEAIVEAHALGIVHRDLKPANLFLTKRRDGSPLVKVLDFGISKVEGGSRPDLTSATTLMGSPRYMSPEQMLSAKDVDARTDVWALGVILFELVTGKPVWEADTVQGLCALITSAPAPALRSLAPAAPAALEQVVARCLAKKREDRLASVADLALALEPIAPASARTSIERIVRVGARSRPIPSRPVASAPVEPATAVTTATSATSAPRTGRNVALLLAVSVATLLVAGIALNALVVRRDAGAATAAGAGTPTATTTPSATPSATTSAIATTTPIATTTSTSTSTSTSSAIPVAASSARPPPRGPRIGPRLPVIASGSPAPSPPAAPSPDPRSVATTPPDPGRALSDRK